ncbi:MAG: helix-turn-helix domain-containing protein [Ramlibacter sp.]|nr:helix-turn-helix domain-containing protein [Ramlibacter sp.]
MIQPVLDPTANGLLAALSREDIARWLPHLKPVILRVGEVLHEPGRPALYSYFPLTAVVSLLVPTQDGRCDEVCVVGREGMLGVSLFMDAGTSASRAVVQSAGMALRVPADWIQREFANSPSTMQLLLRYMMTRGAELAQSVVCSRHHTLTQRLCRRLLQGLDRQEGAELRTTQEQLAGLLGVRRESITEEALKLQRAGLIRYARGHITLLDRTGLEQRTCECYALGKNGYLRLAREPADASHVSQAVRGDLATHLQKIRDQERGDLARELHDELGSLLTRAKLDLAGLKLRLDGGSAEVDQRMQHLGEMINLGIAFSRRVVEGLHPSSLTNLGLAASLVILGHDFERESGIVTDVHADEAEVDAQTQLAIFRVVQESLNNISKYANAHRVGVTLLDWGSELMVTVRDDGCGFDPGVAGTASHGLASMRHRVQSCGGEFTVSSQPGTGVIVVAMLPRRLPAKPVLSVRPSLAPQAAQPLHRERSVARTRDLKTVMYQATA